MAITLLDLGVDSTSVQQRVRCPKCQSRRRTLSVAVDRGLYHCFRCHWAGRVGGDQTWIDSQIKRIQKADQKRDCAQARAARNAQSLWSSAGRAMWHPYLKRKAVLPLGIRQCDQLLIIPMFDANGRLWSCQTIDEDGEKRFLRGGRTTGLYYPIQGESEAIYICEGFATGAALHLYFRKHARVAVAFNCANLRHVGISLRVKYPDAPLVIAADNDSWSTGNPGLTKAREAAKAVGARVIYPQFDGLDATSRPTDFADLNLLRWGGKGDGV